ncbi:MAG: competence/damage-inducible protein A [Bacteroidales bacterium]
MLAEIINIGDELLIGQVVNTNAAWLGEELTATGIAVLRSNMIRDDREQIIQALTEARKRADIIILTGGLGPTKDDITKQTLCDHFGSTLVFHPETYSNIVRLLGARGRKVMERNRKQAEIPEACTPIPNEHGTAPGMWFENNGKIIVSLPGVPYELKPMITGYVIPRLSERFDLHRIYQKTVLTQGMGESSIADAISEWESALPGNISLAYLPQPGIVRLRITAVGDDRENLKTQVERQILKLHSFIPNIIFGYNHDTLEEVVGSLLNKNGATVSTAESCTGGYIAHLLTSIPGSSDYFAGSVVAYANRIKASELGVSQHTLRSEGAVSEATVREMARGIKKRFNTAYAIAVSGIAGPTGSTPDKPVGTTWIAIAGPGQIRTRKFLFGEHRMRNIRKAALTSLQMLRWELAG